jgi:translation initiation factor 3 subunit H
MASGRGSSRRVPDNESSIAYVQMDGLVNITRININVVVMKKYYFCTQVCIFVFSTKVMFFQAIMKMIKHSHEESTGNMEVAQGALLGLVVENCLEITNCFPFPKHNDESMDEGNARISCAICNITEVRT